MDLALEPERWVPSANVPDSARRRDLDEACYAAFKRYQAANPRAPWPGVSAGAFEDFTEWYAVANPTAPTTAPLSPHATEAHRLLCDPGTWHTQLNVWRAPLSSSLMALPRQGGCHLARLFHSPDGRESQTSYISRHMAVWSIVHERHHSRIVVRALCAESVQAAFLAIHTRLQEMLAEDDVAVPPTRSLDPGADRDASATVGPVSLA